MPTMRIVSTLRWSTLRSCILVSLVIFSFFSCSQAEPRLMAVSLNLVYRRNQAAVVERLSCFALAEDDDGFADIEELRLINDRDQLYWTLTSKDWISVVRSGETWVGSYSLSMPEGMSFPRGVYRVVVVDKGGERNERSVSFDAPVVAERPFPTLKVEAGSYSVSSDYPKNMLVIYGDTGAPLRTVQLDSHEGRFSDLSIGPKGRTVALWAEDAGNSVAAFTESVPIE